jgi:hypothetical protein
MLEDKVIFLLNYGIIIIKKKFESINQSELYGTDKNKNWRDLKNNVKMTKMKYIKYATFLSAQKLKIS